MQKLSELKHFQEQQNIVLQGYDPISAGGFTQVPNAVLHDPQISTNAKVVYAMLLSYAWHNNKVFPGQERMAEDIGISRPSVTKSIGELVKAGYLEVTRRGQGKTNVYILKAVVKTSRG